MNEETFGIAVHNIARKVGKQMAYRYPHLDADDIQQEISLRAWENRPKLAEVSRTDLEKALKWYANIYAMKEFDHYLRNSGNWIYNTDTVKRVLKTAINNDDVWDLMPSKESDRGTRVEAGGLAVFLMDLKEGYRKLNERERDMIELHLVDGVRTKDLSEGDRGAIKRGFYKLASHLNKELYFRSQNHTGVGSSRAHTARAAKARVEHAYDPRESYEDSTGYRFCGGKDA
ncbi:hypothetical protein ACFYYS_06310 [Streptomyces sp. NPDC002120]|uniref:hypothetical protein n=1 Tax=Streptomyces sp. NPDC002120 TaxID=3364631 RepID=UPI00368D1B9D